MAISIEYAQMSNSHGVLTHFCYGNPSRHHFYSKDAITGRVGWGMITQGDRDMEVGNQNNSGITIFLTERWSR